MIPSSERLDQGLIVSVQAPMGSPMRDPEVIAAMAEASSATVLSGFDWKVPNTSVLFAAVVRMR